MFPDIDSIESVCELTEAEKNLLLSSEAPIVLLKQKPQNTSDEQIVAYESAGLNPNLGVMLPYTPLHHILMSYLKIPVIATSGNISEEPICIDDAEAFKKLGSIADYFLTNNRKILRHVDDSIVRIAAGREYMMRRARGYAPLPLVVEGIKSPVLAVGPHLKNTVALNNGSNVFVSQHIGDLENAEAINAFERVISDFESFYEVTPEAVVCDMHPDYVSTKYGKGTGLPVLSVQHHYAHVLSCMAENELSGEVLGVSWDGTGYGIDGTIWGGEFLVPEGRQFRRAGHLRPFRIPGGDKAIHQVWRLGLAVLYETFGTAAFEKKEIGLIASAKKNELRIVQQMIDSGLNSPITTSAGRMFDAVSAIIGLKHEANFEAQAAMELEFMAEQINTNDYYDFDVIDSGGAFIADWRIIVSKLVDDIYAGAPKPLMAAKFHNSLAEIIIRVAQFVGINKVVLTGGCFLNTYLLERTISRLQQEGFAPYWHQRVPAGDGGISLGQIKYMTYL
jgi:hydrogenase maturation protein HypF